MSVGVLTQQITNVAKTFREDEAAIVLFYSPSAKTTETIFEDYAGGLSSEEYKEQMNELKNALFLRYQTSRFKTFYIDHGCCGRTSAERSHANAEVTSRHFETLRFSCFTLRQQRFRTTRKADYACFHGQMQRGTAPSCHMTK